MEKKPSRWRRLVDEGLAVWNETAFSSQTNRSLTRVHQFAHFWVLVWKSFVRNRCPIRASALAYATLLALIPMLAVVFSVTSSFLKKEGEDRIDKFIVDFVARITPPAMVTTNLPATGTVTNLTNPGLEETVTTSAVEGETNMVQVSTAAAGTNGVALPSFLKGDEAVDARKQIARYINHFIQNTRSGAMGITGSILLIFVGISMLSRVEDTFNDIWGISRGRTWSRRIVLYWSVISLAPILLVVALGLATGPHLEGTRKILQTMPFVSKLLFQLLPVAVLCITFALIYVLMPNTKVHWSAALAGGLAGGFLFHMNNVLSVLYVSRVVSNSKIYGSLGLVPVFMIGLYFCWLILLFGAQVAYAYQNRATYLEEKRVENINQRGREFVALRLMTFVGQRFLTGEPPPTAVVMGERLSVPTRLVQQVMQVLSSARLVLETAGLEVAYTPARPLEQITCHDVLLAMRASQGQELATRDEGSRAEVYGEFERIQEAERVAASSVSMRALSMRALALNPALVNPQLQDLS